MDHDRAPLKEILEIWLIVNLKYLEALQIQDQLSSSPTRISVRQ